ncbi:FMN-binding glutamate synthase family protein [Fulvivirgaceae bacterium BMA10]|uniref:FMN-binding glutamate synthase family protein n=1 Tax=Splendidivirga corallicola TaxID=3051826 RepID=A0ABT8KXN5_9BACT|nr:FMN-binding glutamate synthase family protein [Fulvivirgaceae bacterium BMA10]
MAYKISAISKGILARYARKGKEKALTPPNHVPPLQRPMDYIVVLLVLAIIPVWLLYSWHYGVELLVAALIIFGIRDIFIQDDHTITRIYGPLGRLRYLFENVFRDKYLQYFNETNTDGRPMPKIVRDYVYQKAKGLKSLSSFGTELDIYDIENTTNTRILHNNFGAPVNETSYGFEVGGHRDNVQAFHVKNSINISAMSYGALNYKAAECLSLGTRDVAYLNTGEGGCGPHVVAGNDAVWQLGTGKFGAGKTATLPNGEPTRVLDKELFKQTLQEFPNIRMIQLKISQGAKPGLGGHLPGAKVTPEIADVRKVKPYETLISPSQHAELYASSAKEAIMKLMDFCKELRALSALPVGIKMCIGKLSEIDMLVEAMKLTGEGPDMIQLDGADGGTGAGPNLFVNYVGYGGAIESVAYLNKKLIEAGIRDHVKISASGRLFTPAHAMIAFAYGADTIETARAAMLAIGCIQALKCHTNHCPTGITTNNKWRMHGIDIPEKSTRIHKYLKGFHHDLMELTRVLGHADPRDVKPNDIRTITQKSWFASHFEEDPFGFYMPSPVSEKWGV